MPRFIVKLNDGSRDYYLEWSTVVDAPVTFGETLEDFIDYYRKEYGESSMGEFERRMDRVKVKGTSCHTADSPYEVIRYNRAGKNGTRLSPEQIIDAYCVNTDWALVPEDATVANECPIEGTRQEEYT